MSSSYVQQGEGELNANVHQGEAAPEPGHMKLKSALHLSPFSVIMMRRLLLCSSTAQWR